MSVSNAFLSHANINGSVLVISLWLSPFSRWIFQLPSFHTTVFFLFNQLKKVTFFPQFVLCCTSFSYKRVFLIYPFLFWVLSMIFLSFFLLFAHQVFVSLSSYKDLSKCKYSKKRDIFNCRLLFRKNKYDLCFFIQITLHLKNSKSTHAIT